jgi:hypothetical protein
MDSAKGVAGGSEADPQAEINDTNRMNKKARTVFIIQRSFSKTGNFLLRPILR